MPTEWKKKLDKKEHSWKKPKHNTMFVLCWYIYAVYIHIWMTEKKWDHMKKRRCTNGVIHYGMHYKMPQCNEQVCGGEC